MTARVLSLLTDRQRLILTGIREYYTLHGYPPTLREIATAAGLASASTARYQLQELERMGWIRRAPGLPRALVVLDPADGSTT